MSVYFKFKSAKDYNSVAIDGHFITVGHLKEKIFVLKQLGRGTDFDLVVTNAQTNEEYLDEGMLIPKNTSVVVRRVPGPPRNPIKTAPVSEQEEPNGETNCVGVGSVFGSFAGVDPSAMRNAEEFDLDEFGNDVYAIPETVPAHSSTLVQDTRASKEDEESKIKALIETSALDWQHQPCDGYGGGRGLGRGFGRGGFEKKTPPQGYTCHRCKVPGHFIQHCPTNGDPNFDITRVKPPTGIPKSMLMATPVGSYAFHEAAFEKEIEGMPSTRPAQLNVPPELHCPLCKQVMKDAVLTSKCCFASFCYTCIRDDIISKARCVCGATKVLADDLLPNKTLRDTINRFLESNSYSDPAFQAQGMESCNPQAKVPSSPTQSAASKGRDMPVPPFQKRDETANNVEDSNLPLPQEKGTSAQVSEDTSRRTDEEVPVSGEAGKKKKKLRQEFPPENYTMPFAPRAFNPYWNGGLDGFMPPCGGPLPYMGYEINPMYDPFGGPGCMLPYGPPLPQRDLAELAMGGNAGPPITSGDEFEAPKADLKRKRETERREERQLSTDGEKGREGSSTGYVSSRSKDYSTPPSHDHRSHRSPPERRTRDVERGYVSSRSKDKSTFPFDDHHRHRSPPERRSRDVVRGYVSSRSNFKSTHPSDDHLRHRSPPERRSRDVVLPRPSSKKKSEHKIDRLLVSLPRFSNNRPVNV